MRRRFPGVLDKITLTQQIRLVERNTKVNIRSAIGAAEVIDEVGKASESAASRKRKRAALVERRTLARCLSQDLEAATESVLIPDLGQCVLDQEVLGPASLRQVGRDTDS